MKMPLPTFKCLLICVIMIFHTSACKKYLQEKSDSSLLIPHTIEDLQGMLDDDATMNNNTPGFGETCADDYFISMTYYDLIGPIAQEAYSWSLKNYNFRNDWAYAYHVVYSSNYCLEKIKEVKRTNRNEEAWDNIMGSALFFRGYYFMNLAWEYAKVYDDNASLTDKGIVLRLSSDYNIPSVRATAKESYDQAIKDLTESIVFLPDHPRHVMRPSKAASYGALARIYLSMGKYDSALKYSNLSLQIKSELLDYNDPEVNISASTPFKPFNQEMIFYSTQSWNYFSKASFISMVDTTLYDSFADDDLRKSVFFYPSGGYKGFKGNYSSISQTFFSGLATDETRLIKAECLARKGMTAEAMHELNALLSKRWATGTFTDLEATDPAQALNIILLERRKELLFRGLRWIDIKRFNKEGAEITLTRHIDGKTFILPPNDDRYALPLPADIIELTGMPQN